MKKKILSFAILLSSSSIIILSAENASDFYKKGNYSQALSIYQSQIEKEPFNPYLLFNIGNCFYKQGNIAKALAYYIKAFKILPRNKEIKYNMEFTAKQTGQNLFLSDVPQIFYILYYWFSDAELKSFSMISLFLFILASSFLFWDKYKNKAINLMLITGILFITFFGWMTMRKNSIFYSPGVIVTDNAKILSGPGENFKVSATINSPKIVRVIENSDSDYVEIGVLEEGVKGWIKKEDIDII